MHVSDSGDRGLTAGEIHLQMHARVKDVIRITATYLACAQRCLKGYSSIPQIDNIREGKQSHSQSTLLLIQQYEEVRDMHCGCMHHNVTHKWSFSTVLLELFI